MGDGCRFHVNLPGCNLTGKCGNPLLVFRRWHGTYLSISSRMIYTIHGCYWNRFFVNVLTTIDLLSNSTRWAPTTYKYVYTSRCYNPSYPFIMLCIRGYKSPFIKIIQAHIVPSNFQCDKQLGSLDTFYSHCGSSGQRHFQHGKLASAAHWGRSLPKFLGLTQNLG